MPLNDLKDVYIDQVQDLYSACKQSHDVTKELIDAAKDDRLRQALINGADGIRSGMSTAAEIARAHGAEPDGEHCKGMEGLVKEARAHGLEEEFGDEDAQDAMIITQYQRMTHYGLAGWGCLVAFAKRLGFDDDVEKLQTALDNAYDGDREMTDIATGGVNKKAA